MAEPSTYRIASGEALTWLTGLALVTLSGAGAPIWTILVGGGALFLAALLAGVRGFESANDWARFAFFDRLPLAAFFYAVGSLANFIWSLR